MYIELVSKLRKLLTISVPLIVLIAIGGWITYRVGGKQSGSEPIQLPTHTHSIHDDSLHAFLGVHAEA